MSQMTLGDMEMVLRPLRDDLVFPDAFGEPASYRGYYEEVAFTPAAGKTVRELKAHVQAAYGAFLGYKGGAYEFDAFTPVNIAAWGECGSDDEDEMTFERFQKMLDAAATAAKDTA